MAFTPTENLDMRKYGILADGGTSITAWYPVGDRDIEDCGLIPGNTLPQQTTVDDAGTAGIVGGRYDDRQGMRYAVITAHLPAYYQAVQDRTGIVSGGAFAGGVTTVTATTAIFYPSLVGESVVIATVGTFVVASYTSSTVIVVTDDASAAAADTITFDEGSRLLTEAHTDAYQWARDGWWTVVRKWLCETEDREVEMQYLKRTNTYTFAADVNSVVGRPSGASSRGRDSMYPHKASITMSLAAPIYDK